MTDDATRALRAVAHPVRLRILSLLTGAELSAAEVARELGLTHANASYHLRLLLDAGQLEVASEERIRGGVAKRYRHPWDRERSPGVGRSAPEQRLPYLRAMAGELVRRGAAWDDAPGLTADAELWVSEEELAAAREALHGASQRMHAAARPPRTPGTVRVAMTAALFRMAPDR